MLQLTTFFHLNMAFSSVEERQRRLIVENCYWPLLRLIAQNSLPAGIEAPAWTLQTIGKIDPRWLAELRRLLDRGMCEFIGSGYAQLIGPLVPAELNEANLRLGNEVYRRLLELKPRVALINEQTYSAGLVAIYLRAGYKAIIMEWDNAYKHHPEWDPDWRYLPQYAVGSEGESIPLIWNMSVSFQKFQRYAHDEMELEDYLQYVRGHASLRPRAFSLYGNDAELFDFRPGRFETEAPLQLGEWERIGALVKRLQSDSGVAFVKPSEVLKLISESRAGNRLVLETAGQPVPVKKQEKYNLTRWAVTGRDNLTINTACWRIYDVLRNQSRANDDDWRELCYLWSSDFRTHITSRRWQKFRERLDNFTGKMKINGNGQRLIRHSRSRRQVRYTIERRSIVVETSSVRARLNCSKGLALDSLIFKKVSNRSLCGTIPHGYFDDISFAADYYTGHLIFEGPGTGKVTDLNPCTPKIERSDNQLDIAAEIPTKLGRVRKIWTFWGDSPNIGLRYELDWPAPILGSLRLGHVTIMPESFERGSLFYSTHNGGYKIEKFRLNGQQVQHGRSISFLVSAAHALGITEGHLELGDGANVLCVEIDKKLAALIGMITYQPVKDSFFFRAAFSARELDDTSQSQPIGKLNCAFRLSAATL